MLTNKVFYLCFPFSLKDESGFREGHKSEIVDTYMDV